MFFSSQYVVPIVLLVAVVLITASVKILCEYERYARAEIKLVEYRQMKIEPKA